MFIRGTRCRNYSTKDILPSSGRLIPEFDGRRSIRQMFTQGSALLPPRSAETSSGKGCLNIAPEVPEKSFRTQIPASENVDFVRAAAESSSPQTKKRAVADELRAKPAKRIKTSAVSTADLSEPKGQQSLKGFFKPKATLITYNSACRQATYQYDPSKDVSDPDVSSSAERTSNSKPPDLLPHMIVSETSPQPRSLDCIRQSGAAELEPVVTSLSGRTGVINDESSAVHDSVESKDSWSRLFTKPVAPRCEGHNEPCITLSTKKSGMNYGRSFWMCPRPLGPTGQKERNTQWRCQTFIWCSDWNSNPTRVATSDTVLQGES